MLFDLERNMAEMETTSFFWLQRWEIPADWQINL
jgi:hypothetical protein